MNIPPSSATPASADEPRSAAATPGRSRHSAGTRHGDDVSAALPPRMRAMQGPLVAVLVATHAVLAWLRRSPSFTTMNDDAFYVLLARSVRQLHYVESFIVGAPFHVQYPPGYPAFLAALGSVFGERYDVFVTANIVLTSASLVFGYLAVRHHLGSATAMGVLALSAINPLIIEMAGVVRSEPMLLFLWAVALWALPRSAGSRGWTAFVIACAALAALTRTAGLPLGAAITLLWLWQRRWYASAAIAITGAVTIGAWLVWATFAPQPAIIGASYLADVAAAQQREGSTLSSIRALVERVGRYLISDVPFALSIPTIPNTPVDNVISVAVMVALLLAGIIRLWARWSVAILVVALYGGILAVWPYDAPRFVIPIVPLLYAITAAGAVALARRFGEPVRWVVLAVGAIVAGAALTRSVRDVARATECDRAAPRTSTSCFSREQVAFVEALGYVRDSTPPDFAVLAAKEATVAQTTGHDVVRVSSVKALTPEALLATLRRDGVSRVVLGALEARDRQIARALHPLCDRLVVERRYPGETYVFRLTSEGARAADSAACDVLSTRLANWGGGAPIGLW